MATPEINLIKVQSALDWDQYFMLQAMVASFKSKDPSTKVGAVFVDEFNHQITMGYNGFVAGINENMLPWGKETSVSIEHQKYAYVVHAEANAILHSPRSLEGSTAYVTLFPCHECAKLLASSKIKEIVYLSDKHCHTESNRISKRIFDMMKIPYRSLEIKEDLLQKLGEHFIELMKTQYIKNSLSQSPETSL